MKASAEEPIVLIPSPSAGSATSLAPITRVYRWPWQEPGKVGDTGGKDSRKSFGRADPCRGGNQPAPGHRPIRGYEIRGCTSRGGCARPQSRPPGSPGGRTTAARLQGSVDQPETIADAGNSHDVAGRWGRTPDFAGGCRRGRGPDGYCRALEQTPKREMLCFSLGNRVFVPEPPARQLRELLYHSPRELLFPARGSCSRPGRQR
jgi:hypothetical protein